MTALPAQVDVLVVGLGPAGSATAAHLARRGYRVLAIDRAAFPRHKPCAEYVSPEAVRLLNRLGVVDLLERDGAVALQGTRVFGPGGSLLAGRFAAAPVRPGRETGLSVARWTLDRRLVDAAREAGARIAERVSVAGLLLEHGAVGGAALALPDGGREAVRARLVVGADGLRSVIARRLGLRRSGRPARLAFVTHLAGVSGLDGMAELHVGRDGYAGLNRIGGGPWEGSRSRAVANVALVVPKGRASAARGQVEEFFFGELERFPGLRGRIPRHGLLRPVQVTGPFAVRSRRVVADGALLVGDAAEFFDPFTGDGILSALRGAELAAAAAAAALARPGLVTRSRLRSYVRARRSAFRGKWAIERLVGYGLLVPWLFDRAIARLERRGLAHTFIGATGGVVPARAVLNPSFLARMVF